jgi:formate dehydrogenase major subunit
MTQHWIDIKNANAILIMGSNAAEHHPISFKWVLKAKDNGATVIHVDPKFSRTSARCNFHVPLRSGTDIAFLGGMMKYIIDKGLYEKFYVENYTNAAFIVGEGFEFKDGMFSGYDPATKKYDQKKWAFAMDDKGVPKKDPTLKDPRCVFQLLKKHYSRYNLDDVSAITGVSKENLLKVYDAYAATGKPDKAGTMMYALGWTQHSVGVQNIRLGAMIQLMLGNIGVAGGGVNALRGEPNVQGSTDHAILWHIIPGYHNVPSTAWPTFEDYLKGNTPKSNDPKSVNWWQNRPKYVVSLLKAWFGDNGTEQNGFCYGLLPKVDPGVDLRQHGALRPMLKGKVKGGFIYGHNPAQSMPNTHKVRKALTQLDFLVVGEAHDTETFLVLASARGGSQGRQDRGVPPALLPARREGRHHLQLRPLAHVAPQGLRAPGRIQAHGLDGGRDHEAHPRPVRQGRRRVPRAHPEARLVRRLRRRPHRQKDQRLFTRDCTVNGKDFKKGDQVPAFTFLTSDGSTVSLNWLYSGGYPAPDKTLSKRRDLTQTPMQAKIGLFPNFSWCWPVNRRIIYNRASVDLEGKPLNPNLPVIAWEGDKWVGDIPDGPAAPMAAEKGVYPFIMHTEGMGQLYGPGRVDGPFPEHYEPAETPVTSHPFSKQLSNPCIKIMESDMDALAKPGDPKYPIVLTTYSMTEHWCGGGDTRNTPALLEAEPQLYVEMSQELAKEKGIKNGDPVIVESIRGKVEAIAMVTMRIVPLTVKGKTVHLIGMPFCFGWTTPGVGDATQPADAVGGRPQHHHSGVQGLPCRHPQGRQGHGTGQINAVLK